MNKIEKVIEIKLLNNTIQIDGLGNILTTGYEIFSSSKNLEELKQGDTEKIKRFRSIKDVLIYSKNRLYGSYKSSVNYFITNVDKNEIEGNLDCLMAIERIGEIIYLKDGALNTFKKLDIKDNTFLQVSEGENFIDLIEKDWIFKKISESEIRQYRMMKSIIDNYNISNITFMSNINKDKREGSLEELKKALDGNSNALVSFANMEIEFFATIKGLYHYDSKKNILQCRFDKAIEGINELFEK